jgi:pyruvate carboxylase
MRRLGNKVEARNLAHAAGMPATPPLPADDAEVRAMAHAVGFPMMLKASWGGRRMRVIEDDRELVETVATA